jgi:uncharacterized protein (TIGR03435 family)
MDRFENNLRDALREPEPPEYLAEKVMSRIEESSRRPRYGFFLAAAALACVVVSLAVFQPVFQKPATRAHAVIETSDGSLYRFSPGTSTLLKPGARIAAGETVRAVGGAMVRLSDGSGVEMRSNSELALQDTNDGLLLQLNGGSIIVTATKQQNGHLYVRTRDVTVSVVGTVFLVNAEEEGSRVAVIQGEVQVQHGTEKEKLRPGEQVATSPLMGSVPIIKELSWSQNVQEHLALLQQSLTIVQPPVTAAPAVPQSPPIPKWEAVSIKPCSPDPSARGGGRGGLGVHPGRLVMTCMPVMFAIRDAYVRAATEVYKSTTSVPISGGPGWINSDLYSIEAKAEGTPKGHVMEGPMLQALLAARFKLKIRREIREIPVYELVVDRGGLKIEPFKEGDCKPYIDPALDDRGDVERLTDLKASLGKVCGASRYGRGGLGVPSKIDFYGMTFDEFAVGLLGVLDRPVVNKTGLTGLYHFHLEFQLDQTTNQGFLNTQRWPGQVPDDIPTGAPSIFTAAQEQLGVRLNPAKGPGEFLFIENIERPAEN